VSLNPHIPHIWILIRNIGSFSMEVPKEITKYPDKGRGLGVGLTIPPPPSSFSSP